ncbi:hypothetical protein K458DRAFT_464250 [Lentithecium fluviatile CBS 122367]|uniref:Uncharacterized protein n=1 Tax=Lentithecium fluviatile CBS 122367 TaxID=1168545 RepID=A0A6G1III3_9PLEO|nr:hypothetical protein K458DRAFT_464250 [Lentithecium fluviatile CBS 122367]
MGTIKTPTNHRTSPLFAVDKKSNLGYSGDSKSGWIGHLPASWIPYIQLARLSPPAGLFLIYFPHLFGVRHGPI